MEHDRLTMAEIGIDLAEKDFEARILNHENGVKCLFDGRWARLDERASNNGKEYKPMADDRQQGHNQQSGSGSQSQPQQGNPPPEAGRTAARPAEEGRTGQPAESGNF